MDKRARCKSEFRMYRDCLLDAASVPNSCAPYGRLRLRLMQSKPAVFGFDQKKHSAGRRMIYVDERVVAEYLRRTDFLAEFSAHGDELEILVEGKTEAELLRLLKDNVPAQIMKGMLFGASSDPERSSTRSIDNQIGRTTFAALDAWGSLLPARIVNEDLGDYIEDINRRIAEGQRWLVYLRAVAAVFWTGLNATAYMLKRLRKKGSA